MSSTRRFGLAVPVLALLSAVPAPLAAQQYAQVVWEQLQEHHLLARKDDYRINKYLIGVLNGGTSDTWNLQFAAGRSYFLAGACDADCADIDIVVSDLGGNVIVEDLATDDYPMVNFNVSRGGQLSVKVSMHNCKADPCFWGLGVWSKGP